MLIHAGSLSQTIDAVNEAFDRGQRISVNDRKAVANWIAQRQGLPSAYANSFAGFESELKHGIVLFTGERVTSASARHILGEEACRVMYLLDVKSDARQALERASDGLLQCLARAATMGRGTNPGIFCCGKCTVGLWRHLAVGGLDRQEERLQKGIKTLRSQRDGQGGWRKYPFWYTLLTLSAIELPNARAEIRYASAKLERVASRSAATRFAHRRQQIAERALASSRT